MALTSDPLDKLEPLEDYENIKTVAYKTVDTFAGICKRKLWLKHEDNGVARTDGHCIKVDLNEEDMYRKVEHEISHILFRSDAVAKVKFVETYTNRICEFAKEQGIPLPAPGVAQMVDFTINLIEDYRVDSLWGLLYPGSAALMKELNKEACEDYADRSHDSYLVYFICIANGVLPEPGHMDAYRHIFEEALKRVERRGFFSTLLTAKWVVTELVGEIVKQQAKNPQGNQAQQGNDAGDQGQYGGGAAGSGKARAVGMQDLISNSKVPKELRDQLNDVEVTQYKERGADARANKLTNDVLTAKVGDEKVMQALADASQKEMEEILDAARKAVRTTVDQDDWIKKDSMAKVVFHDIRPEDAKAKVLPLAPQDQDTIRRLRSTFYRVMGRRRATLDDTGVEVDLPAFIERIASKQSGPCFRAEELGRGFKSLILIDRSGSMGGLKTQQAERACRIVSKALRYPFVDLNIWGFQSLEHGQVDVARFDPKMESFSTPKSKVDGNTPLHTALRLAVRFLEPGGEAKQLIVITDGDPFFTRRDGGKVPTSQLRLWVREEVRWARKRGINVTCLMIKGFPDSYAKLLTGLTGSAHTDPKHMHYMFGSQRNWKVISQEFLGRDLVSLVTTSFVHYLRNR